MAGRVYGPTGDSRLTQLRGDVRCLAWPVAVVVLLVVAYLLAPHMGQDLAAQLERADVARHAPLTPVDLRWFGGTLPFGYTLWTSAVMAVLGVRVTGAIATVAACILLALLFRRSGAPRPVLGGVVGAVCLAANLAEGRVTFACGVALGLAALLALERRSVAALLAVLAGAASPVASLLMLLCAGTLLLRGRVRDAVTLGVPVVAALAVTSVLFADGGSEPFGRVALRNALVATALAGLCAKGVTIKVGAALGLVMLLSTYTIATPVGSNAIRLSLLFAVPVVAAYVPWRLPLTILAVLATAWPQQLTTLPTLDHVGAPETTASYYLDLTAELRHRGVDGRVETPDSIDHWDAYYLARAVPLARGWLRQVDVQLNDDTFYAHAPTAVTYRAFLDREAVQYVAVSDARLSSWGRRERDLVDAGLPYLTEVWSDRHWTLYEVAQPTALGGASTGTTVTVDASGPTTVRIRWSRWLTVSAGACLAEQDGQVQLRPQRPGVYRISSALTGNHRRC